MESYQIKLKEGFASFLTKINALVLWVRVGLVPLIDMTVLCRITYSTMVKNELIKTEAPMKQNQ